MKLNLKFSKNDFDNMKSFTRAVKLQLGENTYVGSDSLCFYFDYPSSLVAMLRPFPSVEQLEFELESSLPDKK
jgi:hypothetical protein